MDKEWYLYHNIISTHKFCYSVKCMYLEKHYIIFRLFRKLRKVAISFVMLLRLFVRLKQLGFHWKNFHEI